MSDGDHNPDNVVEIPQDDNDARRASLDSDGQGSVRGSNADIDLDDVGDIDHQDSFHDSQSAKGLQGNEKSGPLADFLDENDVSRQHSANISEGSVYEGGEDASNEFEGSEEEDENIDEDEIIQRLEDDDDNTIWATLDLPKSPDDDDDEEEEEEEEEEEDVDAYRERKKLYRFTKFKQERLIAKYMQCIEKLKVVRKKNLYLQDKIFKHVQEKEKVLKECREAVQTRKEKARLQQQDEIGNKPFRKMSDDLATTEATPCESSPTTPIFAVNKPEDPFSRKDLGKSDENEDEGQESNLFDKSSSKTERLESRERKCQRIIRDIIGKGPSKLARLSMKHYHLDILKEDQKVDNECDDREESYYGKGLSDFYLDQTDGKKRSRQSGDNVDNIERELKSFKHQEDDQEDSDVHDTGTLKLQKFLKKKSLQMSRNADDDQQWRTEHERKRSKSLELRRSRRSSNLHAKALKSVRSSGGQSGRAIDGEGSKKNNIFSSPVGDSSKTKSKTYGHQDDNGDSKTEQTPKIKRHCAEKMRRRKSVLNRELIAIQKLQEELINVDNPEEEDEDDFALPEFKYELSDISFTKMSYGEKLRQEVEKILTKTRFKISVKWPLSVKGFKEYFQRQNPYGKVIYTLRHHSQIKHAKKITSKYRYLLHNYNYQVQQYDVLNKVHARNMIYLKSSQAKWEALQTDLFSRFIIEIRNASDASVDSAGIRVSRGQTDRWCAEFGRVFEKLKKTLGCFYRVAMKVDMDIRDLCYSESHGEGVELFEFKHLLRTKETIAAQHYQKHETMEGYTRRCNKFCRSYKNLLNIKTAAEKSVTENFIKSGEMSCELVPKMVSVKALHTIVKKFVKQEAELKMKSGIVPFRHLVNDYERTFVSIGGKRQERRDLQLKFNGRVREVHELFDNMEEIQRTMPELFHEPVPKINFEVLDSCGQRPKTAPPKISTSKSQSAAGQEKKSQTFEHLRSANKSIFFTTAQSRNMLEGSVARPKTAQNPIVVARKASGSKSLNSLRPGSTNFDTQIPQPNKLSSDSGETPIQVTRTSGMGRAQDRRRSLFNEGNENGRKSTPSFEEHEDAEQLNSDLSVHSRTMRRMTTMIASEEAKSKAFAKAKAMQKLIPTAAKTGIIPKITRENMVNSVKGNLKKQDLKKTDHPRSYLPSLTRSPVSPYELETKNWPYHYYTKQSPQLETSSKRRMDVMLGNLVTKPRPMTANL